MDRLTVIQKKLKHRNKRRKLFWKRYKKYNRQKDLQRFRRHRRAVRYLRYLLEQARNPVKRLSRKGLVFIRTWEGFPNNGRPYNDPNGHATVGYGHLLHYGPVRPTDHLETWIDGQKTPGVLSPDEAQELLYQDLYEDYEPAVRALFEPGGKLEGLYNQRLYDALVSFVYNLGIWSISTADNFETIQAAINNRDIKAIADSLLLYVSPGTPSEGGLRRRRAAERDIILKGDYDFND